VTVDLLRSPMVLGRTSGADIVVPDVLISRRHARIAYFEGSWWLSDENSTGGIYIDGSRLTQAHRLVSRERFKLGAIEFHLLLGDLEAEKNELIFRLTSLDAATSLFNAAYFCQRLDALGAEGSRSDSGVCVAMLAIDAWSQHVDRLGEYRANKLRAELARLLEHELGGGRMLGALSSGAFVVAFPDDVVTGVSAALARVLSRSNDAVFLSSDLSWRVQLRGSLGVYRPPLRSRDFLRDLGARMGVTEADLGALVAPLKVIALTSEPRERS
jgi:GGDEF domain-containing protein